MSTEEEQHHYYAYPSGPNSSCQYNAAYMNYRHPNTSDEMMHHSTSDHTTCWCMTVQYPQQQQQQQQQQQHRQQLSSTPAPVYGPSKIPRFHQFVDLATNSSGMTPFFALSDDKCVESAALPDPPHPDPHVFATPQQKHRSTDHHTVPPTPSSMMGMSISPASTMDRTAPRRSAAAAAALSSGGGSMTATPAVHVEARPRQPDVHFTTIFPEATASAGGLSAAAEGSRSKKPQTHAPQEDSTEEKQRRRHEEKGKENATATATDTPAQGRCLSTERKQRSRRGKETTRQGKKSKNNASTTQQQQQQQQKSQCQGKSDTNRSLLECLSAHAHMSGHEDCQRFLATLRCRGDRTTSVLSYSCLLAGTHVIFEGDRGNDLGVVVSCEEITEMPTDGKNGFQLLVRNATDEEVEDWSGALTEKEEEAAEECRTACEELGLTITVVGAVFQFDRQKLTIVYESDARVDFRALLQIMFSKYHCRIWMERVSPTPQ